jgi:hypothetical protein
VQTPDDRAVRILMDTYWTSRGWRDGPRKSGQELDYAVESRPMFEAPRTATHADVVADVVDAYSKIVQQETRTG